MIGACSWLGALCMMLAPFIIDSNAGKIIAIIGLILLTLQALSTRCYNLVLLNIVGVIGYAIHL